MEMQCKKITSKEGHIKQMSEKAMGTLTVNGEYRGKEI